MRSPNFRVKVSLWKIAFPRIVFLYVYSFAHGGEHLKPKLRIKREVGRHRSSILLLARADWPVRLSNRDPKTATDQSRNETRRVRNYAPHRQVSCGSRVRSPTIRNERGVLHNRVLQAQTQLRSRLSPERVKLSTGLSLISLNG